MGANSPPPREVIEARFEEADVSTDRYVNVEDGEKRCYDHDTRFDEPPNGNYGIYADADDRLVVLDVDDYDGEGVNPGLAAVEALPKTLTEESPHGGTHYYFKVEMAGGRMPAAFLEDEFGVKNPTASWGEVQVANKYTLAAGCELDACRKEWHDCSEDGEGRYEIVNDASIAEIDADTLVNVLAADEDIDLEDDAIEVETDGGREPGESSEDWVEQRLETARKYDETLDALMDGDYSEFRDTDGVDRSEAESSLASRLAYWLEGDTRAVEQVIEHEARTKKWDERGESYRSSVMQAAEQVTDFYDPDRYDTSEAEGPDYDDVEDGATLIDLARERVEDVFARMNPPEEEDVKPLPKKKAIHEFAVIVDSYWHWLYPDAHSRSWVNTLYVYDVDRGIYVPSGKAKAKNIIEELLSDFADNHVVAEIVNKLKRLNRLPAHEIDSKSPPPHELVVANGVLNLKTGELSEYTPEKYHTTRVDVEYDPDAECERIDEFFHEVVNGDDVDTLYRLAAHMLLKEYPSRKAALLVGEGANGKGTVLDLFREFIGAENAVSRGLQSLVNYRFASQDLHGKLANLEGDLSPNELDDSRMLKKLTGDDGVTADVKMSNETVEFENHATLMFAVNSVPESPEDTHGWWSRWVYIPFPNRFDGDDAVPKHKMMEELTAEEELKGLLARCVEEIQRYYETDEFFPDVQDADEVREQMKNAANPVRDFATTAFDEVEEPDGGFGRVKKDNVVRAYEAYAETNSLPQMNSEKLKEQLQHLADIDIDSGQTRSLSEGSDREQCFVGVEWTARGAQLAAIEQPDYNDKQDVLDGEWEQDVALAEVREYVADHPDEDVYAVLREFELGGEAFDAVEQVIDSEAADGGENGEEPEGGDEDDGQFEADVPEQLVRQTARDEPEATPADICAEYGLEDAYDEVCRLVEDERSDDGENLSIGEELAREGGDDDE